MLNEDELAKLLEDAPATPRRPSLLPPSTRFGR
jgi:hypothetical protein